MNLTNLVVKELEKNNICVLPTEVAARFYRIESATKLQSRMLFSNQILAFDEFKARFLPLKKEKPVNKVIRKIFLRDLLDKKGIENLEYFSNGKFKESSLVRHLPPLKINYISAKIINKTSVKAFEGLFFFV